MKAWLAAALIAASASAADAPSTQKIAVDDYAWRFPLRLEANADVHVLTLTPEIYRSAADAELRDLRVVSADGAEVSFGLLQIPEVERWRDMPWVLQRKAAIYEPMPTLEAGRLSTTEVPSKDGDFGLRLGAGEYAARLSLQLQSNAVETVPIIALRVAWSGRAALPENTRWWVINPDTGREIYPEHSHQSYDASQGRGETHLVFEGIDLHAFVLRGQAVPSGLSIDQVDAEYTPDPEQYRHSIVLQAQTLTDQPAGTFAYVSNGPFPVHAADIELTQGGVATVSLQARDVWSPYWQALGATTTFDVQVDNAQLLQNRLRFHPTRQRQWLLRSQPMPASPPRLRLYYQPDRYLIAYPGPADLYLLAGHRNALRPAYPVDTLMSELRKRFGDHWSPPAASVGARTEIKGSAALIPPPPPLPYRRWALWAALVLGAAAIAGMALSLLKESNNAGK